MLARTTLRSNLRATIFLAVFAGLASGAVLTALEVTRRTSSVYERFEEFADVADVAVLGCLAGFTEEELEAVSFADGGCGSAQSATEIADRLRGSGGVEHVSSGGLTIVGLADPLEHSGWSTELGFVELDPAPGLLIANPILVEGRLADEDAPDELVLNEPLAASRELELGDTVELRPYREEQLFDVGLPDAVPEGPSAVMRVVGVVRMPDDLQPARPTLDVPRTGQGREGYMFLTPAWWRLNGPDVATYFLGSAVRLAPGVTVDEFNTSLPERLPDRVTFSETVVTDPTPVIDVIDLEATAALVIGIVAAVAALVFVGQALARQVTREIANRTTLFALGFTRRDVVAASVVRSVPIAAGAAVLAVVVAIALSPLGPVGSGRRAEVDPGVRIDLAVIGIGAVAVVAVVLALVAVVAVVQSRRGARGRRGRRAVTSGARLPASMSAGALLGRTRGTGAAVACAAIAVASVAAAGGYLASLRDLEDHPSRYGVTWDLFLGEYSDRDSWLAGVELADAHPAVAATGGFRSAAESFGDFDLLVVSFDPESDPEIAPVVLEGRLPTEADEVALGSAAMDALGVGIGDTVEEFGVSGRSVEVVGRAVGNDNGIETTNPGMVALVTDELFDEAVTFGDDVSPQHVLVRLDEGAGLVETGTSLRDDFGKFIAPPIPPADVRNLRVVAPALVVAASVIVVLAIGALMHTLVTTVRSRRHDLATLRALGFTRGQVSAAVAWASTAVAIVAALVGLPLGVLIAHVAWRSIEDDLGVESPPAAPLLLVLVAALGALVLANLASAVAGRRAVRSHAAEVLRAE